MYESYFGFKDTPFRLSADEQFRYAHKNYLRASAYLAYALQQSEGFVMITGQPGSGKTTLVRDVISEIDPTKFNALNLVTSQLQAEELLRKVALEYGLPAESYNKATLLTCINRHLSKLHEQGQRSILFLDEAQNLSLNGLEELRLLSNLQKGNRSLLQIVLIGHDELRELVLGPDMEHIQQRLIATCQIKPMSDVQTREYILHRLEVVGWQNDPHIDEDVFQLIHQASQGVPRKINHLMSRILLFASLEEKHELNGDDALVIIEELVDERRISLPDNETYEEFIQRFQLNKLQQIDDRQVTYKKAVVHDIFENQPLQEQFFDETEIENRKQHISNTDLITKNLLSAIDASAREIEEAWDLPDSDWSDWDSDLTVIKGQYTATDKNGPTVATEKDSSASGVEVELFAEEEKSSQTLPSADEIWKTGIDSATMDFHATGARKSKPKVKKSKQSAEHNIPPAEKEDDGWGGVWWMSSERQDKHRNNSRNSQSTRSADQASSMITVEENLSMPSVWVEGCPEVVTPENAHGRNFKPRTKRLKNSIYHVVAWVGIGLLAMLTYFFFSNHISDYYNAFAERLDSQMRVGQAPEASKATGDFAGLSVGGYGDTDKQVSIKNGVSVEKPQVVEEEVTLTEVPSNFTPSDVDTVTNIDLATRYAVFFDFNKAAIPARYAPLLKSVQYKMLTEEGTFLRIIGYSDTQGNSSYNYRLSLRRADEVKQFFTKRGISGERLHVTAVGTADVEGQVVLRRDESARRRRVELILFPN